MKRRNEPTKEEVENAMRFLRSPFLCGLAMGLLYIAAKFVEHHR